MHDNLQKRHIVSVLPTPTGAAGGPVDFNATGDKFIFSYPVPVDIVRYGLLNIDSINPDAGGFVLALDKRVTIGSDSGRVEMATLTMADADLLTAGTGAYRDLELEVAAATGVDGSTVNVGPSGPVRIEPGQEAVLEVTNAFGVTATGYVWLEYVELPFAIAGVLELKTT